MLDDGVFKPADVSLLLVDLGVSDPEELWLEPCDDRSSFERPTRYLVHGPGASVTVERFVARDLRAGGAGWAGDVARDPCAVA